ncbi:hypothetical protein [Streptomyces turgidiscabies]|uniref:hypothetical protein n=1 Tax=Streptomyces turgidiscabies TaxID=85558 RepID=UPI0038F70D78
MIIVYTPAGGEPEEFDASTLRVSEVSIVQRTIDMKWEAIKDGLAEEDIDAMRGVAWVLKKRSQMSLRFAEFDPGITEMVTRMDKREVTDYVQDSFQLVGTEPAMTREAVAHALRKLPLAAYDREHAEQLIAELAKDPKDQPEQAKEAPAGAPAEGDGSSNPSPTSSAPETSGSGFSPTSSTSPPTESTD